MGSQWAGLFGLHVLCSVVGVLQGVVELVLLVVAAVQIPLMLFAKPFLLWRRSKQAYTAQPSLVTSYEQSASSSGSANTTQVRTNSFFSLNLPTLLNSDRLFSSASPLNQNNFVRFTFKSSFFRNRNFISNSNP